MDHNTYIYIGMYILHEQNFVPTINLHTHVYILLIEMLRKARQHNGKTKELNITCTKQLFFKEILSACDINPQHLLSRRHSLPTKLPRQLSWLG